MGLSPARWIQSLLFKPILFNQSMSKSSALTTLSNFLVLRQ
ncbi:hypothetical protein Nizo2814_2571 [Lactiplantibacillus plantarum]|nr:hypothetical protein Nizo2814_2571 [Lactiplantibacillus plantarum]